jgi:hypothetical protein
MTCCPVKLPVSAAVIVAVSGSTKRRYLLRVAGGCPEPAWRESLTTHNHSS